MIKLSGLNKFFNKGRSNEIHVINNIDLELPEKVTNVIKCKNPRCITTVEQEIEHIFKLTDKENRVYRCIYCESKAR